MNEQIVKVFGLDSIIEQIMKVPNMEELANIDPI
jgi:hypothetical protein